jgi:hypothetical protein
MRNLRDSNPAADDIDRTVAGCLSFFSHLDPVVIPRLGADADENVHRRYFE